MAIALLGYDQKSASQNLSTTLNIPSGTTYMLAACNGYGGSGVSPPVINGVAMTQIVSGSGGATTAYLFGLANPTTGASVSASVSVASAWSEGLVWDFAFFSGVDTASPVRDSDTAGASSGGSTNTLDCQAGDYAFVDAGGDLGPSFTLNITEIASHNELNQIQAMAGALVASGSSITVGTTNGNYSTNVCCTLRPSGGEAGGQPSRKRFGGIPFAGAGARGVW